MGHYINSRCRCILVVLYFFTEASGNGSIFGSVTGFGIYVTGIAAIAVLISAYIFRSPTDNLKDSFNTIKKDIENKINTTTQDDKANNPGNTNPPA